MKSLKLTIDLLPKGAWGNNLSKTLPQKDWDTLRNNAYIKARYACAVCGESEEQLHAHEVWDFDIPAKTQTLKDITALCPACHGVKHFRNSTRIGYGERAKEHFLAINQCDSMVFAAHSTLAEQLFEERNEVYRWKVKADLKPFGGYGIELKERNIPFIENPYDTVDAAKVEHTSIELGDGWLPTVRAVEVNNYDGTITVASDFTNKIQWLLDEELIQTKYNISGTFKTKISVENLTGKKLRFILIGNDGQTFSKEFALTPFV
ncbi:MAG: hypothetical protein FWH03_04530 [Firmicutes bacterium]|nr:hypothetical protein [Bacillota bacterium]